MFTFRYTSYCPSWVLQKTLTHVVKAISIKRNAIVVLLTRFNVADVIQQLV